jgi:hypothetical protein
LRSPGIRLSSRMTVVRLRDGGLWLHSPVPLSPDLRTQLAALGEVRFVVAPNKMHHLFAGSCMATYPQAQLYGAPGLAAKRPGLRGLRELGRAPEPAWQDELDQVFFDGLPLANESAWFHHATGTLILTDLCQWWQGELPPLAALYAQLTGVRRRLAVPRTVRLAIRDKRAAWASAQGILQWPITRVLVAHNAIVDDAAHAAVAEAFACLRA